jgi:hypothetical protein
MKHYLFFLFFMVCSFLSSSCARRCTADINLGNIDLQNSSLGFLPASQKVSTMTFSNAAGQTLVFKANEGSGESRFPYSVETLCERGDFLDRTVQTANYNAQAFHYDFKTADNAYTLNIDLMPQSAGTYGNRNDTIFYETFAVWGQKLTEPTRVGSLTVLTHERGNEARLSDLLRNNTNHYQIVADTTFNGRHIQDAFVPENDGKQALFVFYTKVGGIEAFTTTDAEVWVRQ